ncbi:MAG: DsbA family protein, partial [Desulfobacterales bacterium]
MPVLGQVLEQYPTEVKIVFKNFPLKSHEFAKKAATAAMAAESQGKFWEFHDLLFENYDQLDDKKIRDIAVELGLDMVKFDEKMKDPLIQERISQDLWIGNSAGVRGTPTVFINGKRLR